MVKVSATRRLGLATAFVLGLSACAHAKKNVEDVHPFNPDHPLAFKSSPSPAKLTKLWTLKMGGRMTDLSVASDNSVILVATVPDREIGGGSRKPETALFAPDGRRLWMKELDTPVKSQSVAPGGKLAFVATYDGALLAIDRAGREAWSIDASCKPIALGRAKRFVCFHDDDTVPTAAFDIYNWEGDLLLSYPVSNDVLAIKLSADEKNLAIALTDGQVVLFGSDFRAVWQATVPGEIVDLAVASGAEPKVVVLYNSSSATSDSNESGEGQRIALLGAKGAILATTHPSAHAEQVEFGSRAPQAVFVYGNGMTGQYLGYFPLGDPAGLVEKWHRGDPHYANYSTGILLAAPMVVMGYEDLSDVGRHSHLLGFDAQGDLKWNLPLVTEEGVYLYARGMGPEKEPWSLLAVGSDDGYLSAFKIK